MSSNVTSLSRIVAWMLLGWLLGLAPSVGMAADLPEMLPAGTLLYVGWPGADQLAETCKDTALAAVLKEPEVARLRQQLGPALDGFIRTHLDDAADLKAYSAVRELLTSLWRYPTALAVIDVNMTPAGPQVDMAVLVQAGAACSAVSSSVEGLLELAGLPVNQAKSVQIGGQEFKVLELPAMSEPLRWGVVNDVFVLSIGSKALAHLTGGTVVQAGAESTPAHSVPPASRPAAEPGAISLADSERFKAAMKTLGASPAAPVLFVDLQGIVATLEKFQPLFAGLGLPVLGEENGLHRILDGIGLTSLQSLSAATVPQADGFTTSVFLHAPGLGAGADSALARKPLTDDDLRVVAKDASWAVVVNWDLAGFYNGLLEALKAVAPPEVYEQITAGIKEFEDRMGMKLGEDVLGSFADTFVLFDAPSNGGVWFSGTTLVAELKPQNRLSAALQLIARMVGVLAEGTASVSLRTEKYRGTEITFVNVAGLPIPVAPAWAQYENRCVLALYPQMVRTALDRMIDKGPSLLDNADFQRGRKMLPKGGHSIAYVETKAGLEQAYSILLPIAQALLAMGQKQGLELDASALPRAETFTRHTFGHVSTSLKTAEGYLSVAHGPTPCGLPCLSMGPTPVAAPLMVSILLPSLARARQVARQNVSVANLSAIARSCLIYAEDHKGLLPPDLEILTQGQQRAYLQETQLLAPNDCSGAKTSYVYVAGQKNVMDPRNVLAYERTDLNDGRGVNVAFLDGHVKFMSMDEFNEALTETKERLAGKD